MQTIGRYHPRKKLGSGSQGSVYLCLDPQLKREVAIKILSKTLLGENDVKAFEQESQALGRFQHQNIVSVYDVGMYKDKPYIVFEHVEGQLLSERIKDSMSLPEVIEMFSGIVSGVAQAHRAKVIHRDLKPQNIMISADGIPKIMDFGIALLLEQGETQAEELVGTPRYMAPEYVRQRQVSPAMDVFSLGAIFYEMLTRYPAFAGASTSDVLARILIGPPKRPSSSNELVDDVLDGICLKALAANPKDRYEDAIKLLETLEDYRKGQQPVSDLDSQGKSTLDFLYRRMQRKKDFPGLADSLRAINELKATSDKDAEKLASVIVNDFALTNKILKVVNSAYYGSFSGKISTISRAIVVLGVDTIRSIASSLIFFEHLSNRGIAQKLKQQMASAMFRAIFAREISALSGVKEGEEPFLCAMFYQLGAVLVTFYLPDEDQEIERLVAAGELTESEAAMQILGVTFSDIGAFVARQWNFPETMSFSMQKLEDGKDHKPVRQEERFQLITHLADEATIVLGEGGDIEKLTSVVSRYSGLLEADETMLEMVVGRSRERFVSMASKLHKDKTPNSFIMQLEGNKPDTGLGSSLGGPAAINLESVLDEKLDEDSSEVPDTESILSHGLQEATNVLLDSGDVSQVFNTVLETLYRGLEFRRVFLCLQKGSVYTGRMGFGEDIREVLDGFKVNIDQERNVFSVALQEGVDVYIADVNDKKIHDDLPKWFHRQTDAGSFVLFPMQLKDRSIGFIYGEYARANQMQMEAKTFNLIKSLRNQMILALRQG